MRTRETYWLGLLVAVTVLVLCVQQCRAECLRAAQTTHLPNGTASCDYRIASGAAGLQVSRDCDDTAQEGFVGDFTYPTDGRTSFIPTAKWIAAQTSGYACWSLEAGCVGADTGLDAMTYGTAFYGVSGPSAVAGDVAEVSYPALDVEGAASGARCRMRFFRQQTGCTDDMTGDAKWLEVCW